MASQQIETEALQAARPTPIAELSPELSDVSSCVIDGCVTITWPFSASKRLLAFVLAEHDFRKRRSKGQVRLEFHGAAGRALDKAKIASGDTVRLSLEGAEWQEQGPQPGLTGEVLGWQLKFSQKLLLSLTRLEATGNEIINVDGEADEGPELLANDEPIPSIPDFAIEAQEEPPAPQTPVMNVSTKRLASTAFDNIEEYVSPAFLKRAKVSYGSLFEGGFEALEEESSRRNKKGRRKSRFSMPTAAWRYSSRSPSPEREEPEEHETSASEDEVPIPGLSFSAKTAPSKTPEQQTDMVDDSSQTQGFDQGPLDPSQGAPVLHSLDHEHPNVVPMGRISPRLAGAAENLQANTAEPIQSDWMSAPAGELPMPVSDALPLPSPMGTSFDFGLESASLTHFDTAPSRPNAVMTPSSAQDTKLSAQLGSSPTFDMGIQQHTHQTVDTSIEHHTPERDVAMQEIKYGHSDAEVSPSVPSHASVESQTAAESQSQPVETIEILSSSPVQSPRIPAENIAMSTASWRRPELVETEAVSDEENEYDEHYEDEDAEGSVIDEADYTHDATPNDDAEVPGEDYDLRKYDDAIVDDEEGNVDRDSLLSTDGEGNVIEPNPGVIIPSSSDSEEEEAALDVDDGDQEADEGENGVELVDNNDPANAPESDVEISASEASVSEDENGSEEQDAESDVDGVEDDEMGNDYEEEEYESDVDDQMQEDPQPQEPVFIDLLSDSEEEGEDEVNDAIEEPAASATAPSLSHQEAPSEPPMAQDKHSQSDERDAKVVEEPVLPQESAQDLPPEEPIGATEIQPEGTQQPVAEDIEVEVQESHTLVAEDLEVEVQASHTLVASTVADDQSMASLIDDEPRNDQEGSVPAPAEEIRTVPTPSEPEDRADLMIVDGVSQVGASPRIEEPITGNDVVARDNSPQEDKAAHDLSAGTPLFVKAQPVSQIESTEPTYHTQPPMSFQDLGMTQSSLSSQTVTGSQKPTAALDAPIGHDHPGSTNLPDVEVEEGHAEATVQQLMTPSETQLDKPAEELETVSEPDHEASPGPDDQLHMEMQQREFDKRRGASPMDENQGHAVTEEEELEAIEDAAEHDPVLAQKDYIITADSLRSHDHQDTDAATEITNQDESQATFISNVSDQASDQQTTGSKSRAPHRRSHRKTRSSGSIDLSTGDAVDDASQETATQQLSQENQASQELGTAKPPVKPRNTRRRKVVQDLDVDAANTSQDSTQEMAMRSLRSSPRGHKRVTSGVLAEEEGPKSPSVNESPQKAEKPTSSKAQLLRMLQSDLPEFLSLKVLRNSLHKTVDILAIAAVAPSAPVRPKNGPRDYMLELILTDPSTAPSTVSVAQIYRPHQKSLPVVKAGDVVLLRRFQVLSMKGRGFGVRAGDDSAWAIFEKEDEEKLPQIMGPPVEVTEEEVMYVMGLAGWWEGMGEEAWRKAEKAGEKARVVSGEGK